MKKIGLFILLLSCFSFSATRTWNASGGNTDACNGNNYSPTGALLTTDSLVLNGTSINNWIMTGPLSVATINVQSTFTGNWDLNGDSLTTVGRLYLNGTDTIKFTGAYTMTGNGLFYVAGQLAWLGATNRIGTGRVYLLGAKDTFNVANMTTSATLKKFVTGAHLGDTTWYIPTIILNFLCNRWSNGPGDFESSNCKLGWFSGASIVGAGTGKQTVYSNGNHLTKIVAKKGSKLTVK